MAATKQEIAELMWQHKAIGKHMEFLTKSLSGLATQSSRGTAQSAQLKDQITLYRWSLYDFREAIRRHIDLDESIVEALPGTPVEATTGEHETIQKQLDDVIRLAENAVYNKLRRDELNKCALDIRDAVNGICRAIGAHMAKEDRLLTLVQKGF